jgi:dTDP-glucose 4,6-dehydratase
MLATHLDYEIVNLDKLTYAGNLQNTEDYAKNKRYKFVKGDIADAKVVEKWAKEVDAIINFAAETHVDRSIEDANDFIRSNVLGTYTLLEAAKKNGIKRFVQISTDEVYGDILKGHFKEESPLKPSSPYSASKAAGDMLCLAYHRTHGIPVSVSRCSNNYGPYQFPEKLIPFFIKKLLKGEKVPIYGNGSNVRDWLHVSDHCRAVDMILHKGRSGEVYNAGANYELSNLEVTHMLLEALNLGEDRIEFVKDRPGHDIRYAIDATKIKKELGWSPQVDFTQGFAEMVEWYKAHLK